MGRGKSEGKRVEKTGCGKEIDWANARDWAQELRKGFKSFLIFQDLDLNEFQSNSNKSLNFF
jgi:hypothetical protein